MRCRRHFGLTTAPMGLAWAVRFLFEGEVKHRQMRRSLVFCYSPEQFPPTRNQILRRPWAQISDAMDLCQCDPPSVRNWFSL